MHKHTPGPWSINSWPQADADIRIGATGTPCLAVVPLRFVSINEQAANSRLIAAAPELLEALRALLAEHAEMNAELRAIGKGRPEDSAHPDCPADMAFVAIAKAEG